MRLTGSFLQKRSKSSRGRFLAEKIGLKAVLKKQGIRSTATTRKPLEEFSKSQAEELFDNLEKLGYCV